MWHTHTHKKKKMGCGGGGRISDHKNNRSLQLPPNYHIINSEYSIMFYCKTIFCSFPLSSSRSFSDWGSGSVLGSQHLRCPRRTHHIGSEGRLRLSHGHQVPVDVTKEHVGLKPYSNTERSFLSHCILWLHPSHVLSSVTAYCDYTPVMFFPQSLHTVTTPQSCSFLSHCILWLHPSHVLSSVTAYCDYTPVMFFPQSLHTVTTPQSCSFLSHCILWLHPSHILSSVTAYCDYTPVMLFLSPCPEQHLSIRSWCF